VQRRKGQRWAGGAMKSSYSSLFIGLLCLSGFLIAAPMGMPALQERPSPIVKPVPSPNAPKSQNAPTGLDGPAVTPENSRQNIDQQNQAEIRLQVQRLYAMATELKDEVDSTNSNTVLNLAVLKRAQEIEKLAKQIRERAKK
jgi:hypothetical protein